MSFSIDQNNLLVNSITFVEYLIASTSKQNNKTYSESGTKLDILIIHIIAGRSAVFSAKF